jgi:hypothetical protein
MHNTFTILKCVEIISRICDDVFIKSSSPNDKDVASSNYVVWKKAVKFHEINASKSCRHTKMTHLLLFGLDKCPFYNYDFLSTGQT